MNERDLTRLGVMEILGGAMAYPPGTFDDRSVMELIRLSMDTHAWCVREEAIIELIKSAPPSLDRENRNLLIAMLKETTKRRLADTARLNEYVMFMATCGEMFRKNNTSH